jgi:signal transduction histidine kinase
VSRTLRATAWHALVLLLVVSVLLELATSDQDIPLALAVPIGVAMTVPLVWGREYPRAVGGVVLGSWVVQTHAGDWTLEPQAELLPVCLVFWCLGAYLARAQAVWSLLAALGLLLAHEPGDAVVQFPLMAGVFAAGRLMRSRDQLARALELEREHVQQYAAAEERARIARELHDVVGHSISLMTVQAGAERMALGPDERRTAEVLGKIEETGRRTMQEMRRLLGVLRTDGDDPSLSPQPGLGRVDELVDRVRGAGLAVEVATEGEPAELSPGLDISAYRIVQEALTNVLRHAEARAVRVLISHGPDELVIDVSDDGSAARGGGRGHGLTGMRERVAVFGGSLDAGPQPNGGWRVVARLPREPAG